MATITVHCPRCQSALAYRYGQLCVPSAGP
ncbi:hypothetical protein F0T03_12170 [Yersinia canariae]|uniref:InsA N-terminal zinc ribbon domain-containing protein n=1 Tax=Yersinia canariae TaxID=2607663 RepID=A0A857F0G6_9GAMM|nr:hypothetical protein F0T03_12170 [Yersinia canariae]